MRTRALEHFKIEGRYGGSQQWMIDPWMHIGGCGALAAVDTCIFLAKHHGFHELIPDVDGIDKKRYRRLGMKMKPFLRPRISGINRLDIFTKGFERFLALNKMDFLSMEAYPMGGSKDEAFEVLKAQIDKKLLVPVLLLNPIDPEWKDFHWHWFLLNGYRYEPKTGERFVRAVTYGSFVWKHWDTFWDDENADNGGMILYELQR